MSGGFRVRVKVLPVEPLTECIPGFGWLVEGIAFDCGLHAVSIIPAKTEAEAREMFRRNRPEYKVLRVERPVI